MTLRNSGLALLTFDCRGPEGMPDRLNQDLAGQLANTEQTDPYHTQGNI
jgi:hypothetical protein